MILESDERIRFAAYCQSVADNCNAIANQFENMPRTPVWETLQKRQRTKAVAYSIVAIDLMCCKTETVGGE
jgi:hypothetical protein